MNKLEIINLTKKYGNKTALNNFTYTFENGVYGLIGLSRTQERPYYKHEQDE